MGFFDSVKDKAGALAADAERAIPVGAGEGAMNGEFVDLLAVALLEILTECIDEFV
jgi:hypothetical protein